MRVKFLHRKTLRILRACKKASARRERYRVQPESELGGYGRDLDSHLPPLGLSPVSPQYLHPYSEIGGGHRAARTAASGKAHSTWPLVGQPGRVAVQHLR